MVFITAQEILETVSMIRSENLDVRAVTMGISLDDCAAGEPHRTAERIHAKIVRRAGKLVEVAAELHEKYGVPIVNRRVSVTPVADFPYAARRHTLVAPTSRCAWPSEINGSTSPVTTRSTRMG